MVFHVEMQNPSLTHSLSLYAACVQGITVLSDYGSLDGCMYFWVGFKGQSHAQQFACVIFISKQYRASTNF